MTTSPWILVPRYRYCKAPLKEAPGHKVGTTAGSYIDDIVALQKTVVLCWACQPKFNYKKYGYYKDRKFRCVQGTCDGCRNFNPQSAFYIHESFLGTTDGRMKAGQCWTPV